MVTGHPLGLNPRQVGGSDGGRGAGTPCRLPLTLRQGQADVLCFTCCAHGHNSRSWLHMGPGAHRRHPRHTHET
jgi:hypothetical protein